MSVSCDVIPGAIPLNVLEESPSWQKHKDQRRPGPERATFAERFPIHSSEFKRYVIVTKDGVHRHGAQVSFEPNSFGRHIWRDGNNKIWHEREVMAWREEL